MNSFRRAFIVSLFLLGFTALAEVPSAAHKLLYVAEPGIRDYLEYGGHGLLVFDIGQRHRFVGRLATGGVDESGKPINLEAVCAIRPTAPVDIPTTRTMPCLD